MSAFPLASLRAVTLDAQTGPFGSQLHSAEYIQGGIPVINPSNIINSKIVPDQTVTVAEKTSERLARHRLEPGDLVFARRGELGRAAVAHNEAAGWLCGTGSLRIRPRQNELDIRFAEYVLQSASTRAYFEINSVGSTMGNLNTAIVLSLPIPLPSLDEQRRIADFLGTETARIDRLDELAFRTASLLTERRQSLIEQSVAHDNFSTRKLFPCLRLLRDGTHQPPPRTATGVPLLTARNVSSGTLQLTEHDTFVSPEDADVLEASLKPKHRDVLLSVKGTVGATAIVPPEFPRAVLDRNLALLRPNSSLLNEWLVWVLRTRSLQDQMKLSIAAAAQPGLPLGAIRELRIPDVDITRQKEQLQQIETIDEQISSLEAKIESQRKLLAERRQALITAAVTGQIDVSTAGRGGTG